MKVKEYNVEFSTTEDTCICIGAILQSEDFDSKAGIGIQVGIALRQDGDGVSYDYSIDFPPPFLGYTEGKYPGYEEVYAKMDLMFKAASKLRDYIRTL
jgi:hypothetical protein